MKCWPGVAARDRGDEPWVVRSFVAGDPYPVRYTRNPDGGDYEETFRTERILVDAPAEKRELVHGWSREAPFGPQATCMDCRKYPGDRALVHGGRYRCEPCAELAGAFAPPAPARACKSPEWCGLPYIDSRVPTSCAVYPKAKDGQTTSDPAYCSLSCKAARAKPAEPKPAPKCDHKTNAKCAVPGGCAEAKEARALLAKPAPAEKAKREWVRQLEGATLTADSPYAKWAALQTGVAPGLEREKRAINVRGVRSIYLPATESQGEKLSRLVESGLRADVRLDETRFEAGLRGTR